MIKFATWVWFFFLTILFVGGLAAEILVHVGFVTPFCHSGTSEFTPKCEPCGLYLSVFAAIEVAECPNALIKWMLSAFISWPRGIIAILTMIIYPVFELLSNINLRFAQITMPLLTITAFARTLQFNLFYKQNLIRGVHRGLITGCIALSSIMALQW